MPTTNSQVEARSTTRRGRQPDRRGSLYVPVLGVAMIVASIGMSAMVVARLNLRSVSGRQDRREARLLADAAVELGVTMLGNESDWRTTRAHDVPYPSAGALAIGGGTLNWKLIDGDGDLADDDRDSVRLVGAGKVGQAVYTKSVILEPSGIGLTCLEVALHSGGDNNIYSGFNCDQIISANDDVNAWGPTANTDVEVVDQFNGSISGTLTTGITPRQMPGDSVFAYYLSNGTWIDYSDIPGGTMQKVVLSPGNNPFGATNPQGIYVIDCQNHWIRIKLVRLVGTLVILNPSSGSDLDNDQHWEPAVPNFPVLMVDGDIDFNWHGEHALRESFSGVNYNPPHTPYQDQSDADQTDEYPGLIKGLVYVTGNLNIYHECVHEGVLVAGGNTSTSGAVTLTYDGTFLTHPPPGFGSGSVMAISRRSWRREVSD